jgi:hypothetical protein
VAKWVNTFWVLTTGYDTATGPDVLELCEGIHGAYADNFQPQAPSASHLEATKVVLYQTSDELSAVFAADVGGAISGDDLPAQVCRVVSWGISSYYRGGHPRTYLCAATYSQLDGVTELDGTTIANNTAAAANYLDDVNALTPTNLPTVTLGTLRRRSGNANLTPPVFYPYFNASCQPRICTQRRRLGREL